MQPKKLGTDSVVILRPECEIAQKHFQTESVRLAIIDGFISKFRRMTGEIIRWETDSDEQVQISGLSPEATQGIAPFGNVSSLCGVFTLEISTRPSSSQSGAPSPLPARL